jgi:SAM-dependent methyltransferase
MPGKDYTGLEAELYDLFRGGDELDEVGLYVDAVMEKEGTCLDIGCGTGRVLIPLALEGVEVTGVDSSLAMVAGCKAKLVEEKVEAAVVQADMCDFDLGKQFDTVIIPGASFQLLDEREAAAAFLAKAKAHLKPDGLLILSLFTPWYEITHESLDGVWRLEKDEVLEDGRRALCHASNELDRCEQLMEVQHRLELLNAEGKIVDSEFKTSRLRWYGKHEIVLLLKTAGFGAVETLGDFGDEEASDGHMAMAVFASF